MSFRKTVLITVLVGLLLGVLLGMLEERSAVAWAAEATAERGSLRGWALNIARPLVNALMPNVKIVDKIDMPANQTKILDKAPKSDQGTKLTPKQ